MIYCTFCSILLHIPILHFPANEERYKNEISNIIMDSKKKWAKNKICKNLSNGKNVPYVRNLFQFTAVLLWIFAKAKYNYFYRDAIENQS